MGRVQNLTDELAKISDSEPGIILVYANATTDISDILNEME